MSSSDKYPNLWANYDKLMSKGKNQEAILTLDSIFSQAVSDQNDPQILKTFFKRNITNNFQEDATEKQINYVHNQANKLSTETGKSIYYSYLAELYRFYLVRNSYKLRNSTNIKSESYPDSISDYSISQLVIKSNELINKSLESTESRHINLELYQEIISALEVSGAKYKNTIHDLLIDRALSHYSSAGIYLPESASEFNFYQEAAFAQSETFINYDFKNAGDSSSIQKVILILQDLEKENEKNKEKLINIELARLSFSYQNNTNPNKQNLYQLSLGRLFEENKKSEQISYIANHLILHLINQGNQNLGNPQKENTFFISANKYLQEVNQLGLTDQQKKYFDSLKQQINKGNLQVQTEQVYPSGIDFPIKIDFRNINSVDAKLYKLSSEDIKDYYESRDNKKVGGERIKNFSITFPETSDFDQHSYEYVMESLAPSAYILELKASNKAISSYCLFHISNIAAIKIDNRIQVVDRNTGEAKTATIDLYKRNWNRNKYSLDFVSAVSTSKEGVAEIIQQRESYTCHIKSGNDFLFTQDNFYHNSYNPRNNNIHQLNFTDRGIYRPGQTVFFKSILYNNDLKNVIANKKIIVELRNVNYQVVETKTLTTNEFGSISGNFELPKNILNGRFQINFTYRDGKINSSKSIQVEEYKRPTFKIDFEALNDTYSFGKEISSKGSVISYNQVPLAEQKVYYTIERNQIYKWYYYSRYYNPIPAKIIANGNVVTDKDGKFTIQFTPEKPNNKTPYNNYSYTIKTKVTNSTGETRTSSTIIYVSDKDFVIHSDKQKYNAEDKKIEISLKNLNGKVVSENLKLELFSLQAPKNYFITKNWESEYKSVSKEEYYRRTKVYPYRDEHKLEALKIEELIHSRNQKIDSVYNYDFATLPKGLYKLVMSSPKSDTATLYIENNSDSFIGKETLACFSPSAINIDEELAVTLKGISPLTIYEVDSRQHYNQAYKSFGINTDKTLNYSINKKDEGGIRLEYLTYFKNRFHRSTKFIQVTDSSKQLKLNWETLRSDLYPGSEEKWRLKIMDNENKIVAAELVSTMYDKSLDAFASENWGTFTFPTKIKPVDISPFAIGTAYGRGYDKEKITYESLEQLIYPFLLTEIYQYHNSFGFGSIPLGGGYRGDFDEVTVTGYKTQQPQRRVSKSMNKEVPEAFDEAVIEIELNDINLTSNINPNEDDIPEIDQSFIRTNLNETVFFKPDLRTNENGEIMLEFKMNEALTEWKMLSFGHTQNLQSVIDEQSVITKKDLMVFPNGPRFFRTGDEIVIPTKVRNMTEETLSGMARIKIFDLISEKEITSSFIAEEVNQSIKINPNSDIQIEWKINVPENIESIRYQVIAETGKHKDGEEKTALVLENRKMVTESKVYVIDQNSNQDISTDVHKSNTSSSKNYNISVVSNPSWMAVQSLPFLMEYRYKCTEQIFARYFSNALAKQILDVNPQIENVYKNWDANNQLRSPLSKNEELKYALLEQSPWVNDALSEEEQMANLAHLFDREKVNAELVANREIIFSRSQNGGLPWFPGGRPNAYISQYILQGFGQLKNLGAIEEDAQLKSFIKQTFKFIEKEVNKRERSFKTKSSVSPLQVHFLYTHSFFPELKLNNETKNNVKRWEKILKDTWLDHSLLTKAHLALYYYRKGDTEMANIILENLRQRSIYKADLGRYWKETNGYNWYQSNIEAQALLMTAFEEIADDLDFVEELKQWLLSNKQTNKWNSTKSTTQAVYAILETGENKLANQETVQLANIDETLIQRSPIKKAVGEYNVKYLGSEIGNVSKTIKVTNPNSNKAWVSTTHQYIEDLDKIDSYQETPIKVKRELFVKEKSAKGDVLIPSSGGEFRVGDEIVIKLTLEVDRPMEFIHIQDSRASGTEPKNVISKYQYKNGIYFYEETKDEATNFFLDYLPRGTHSFEYEVYASQKGDFSAGLATIQSMYAPEFNAHSGGFRIVID